ncbi:hypothetical protein QYF36_013422 [Acer negundo]|nr:hypothetical protein QYF36_013422 [Acer negundo]
MDKIHKKYLLPSYIQTILFSPLYIIFFHHLSVPVAGDSPHVYNPTETIFLYCGSSDNTTSQDGTRWIGDINSEHFPLHQSENNTSTTAAPSQQPPSAVDNTPYMRARLSRSQFSYTFNITPGQKFIRLHFYETSYQNFDRSKAFFSVKAGSFTLLSNFSTSLAANFSVGPTSTTSKAHVSTAVKGSFGYLDPEYIRLQRLTEKSDVYSFGVVLCEVICARAPIIRTVDKIHKKQGNLAGWARQCYDQNGTLDQIVDPVLKGKIAPECLKKFCEVAISCLDDEGIKRPSMSDVVWGLEFALQLQQEYDKLGGGAGNGICVPHLDDDETLIKNYASDYDSGAMFSRIGGHVLESRTMSTMTISSSDEYGFSSKNSDSKPMLV